MATDVEAGQEPGWVQRVLIGRNPKRTLVRIALMVVVCLLLRTFVVIPVKVDGGSMLPTYKENGFNLVNRLAYLFHDPQRGDVVAVRMLAGEHRMFLKRIVGLPGETVAFHGGHVFINGKLLDEPYVRLPCNWEQEARQDGPDQYYVVGDNRDNQMEWHSQGRAPRRLLLGKVLL